MLNDEHPLVRQARADAREFFDETPEAPNWWWYDRAYGSFRVRVFRDGHVRVFEAQGYPKCEPIWDSAKR